MATTSNYLGLKLNTGTDPFLLADFTSNWGIIDASPGITICTSSTRPSLSAGQAGRVIFMTDLKQLSYWNGTSWQDLRDSAPVFAGGKSLNSSCSKNSTSNFTILNLTTPRPCALAVILTGIYQCDNRQSQDVFQNLTVDGSDVLMGNFREQIRFEGNASDAGSNAGANATSLGVASSVSAGAHSIGIKVAVGGNSSPVTLVGSKVLAFISLFASSNSL